MAIRASVQPLAEPGHALLRISELEAAPEGLTLSIQRQQGPESHLADDGWRRTEAWLQPEHVEWRRDALEFHLGPEICDRLAGIATVRLRVREPDIGVVGTTVVAWPAMLTSGAIGSAGQRDDDTLRLRTAEPPPPPEPEPEPELPPPMPPPRPELRGATRPTPPPRRSGTGGWIMTVAALLVIAGGGYYAYRTYFQKPPQTSVAASGASDATPAASGTSQKSVRDRVGEYLATKPTPEAMLAKGREFAKAGDLGAAFLVFRSAAETGSVPAELEVADFYDPLTQPPRGGFTPDGARAADWYERAAIAGSAEAQRKLGLLLVKGGNGLAADPGKARTWLQQAAAQNDAEAKKALDALPK